MSKTTPCKGAGGGRCSTGDLTRRANQGYISNIPKSRRRRLAGVQWPASTPRSTSAARPDIELTHQPEPAGADIEREHGGVRHVEALDLAGHVEPGDDAAGVAGQ